MASSQCARPSCSTCRSRRPSSHCCPSGTPRTTKRPTVGFDQWAVVVVPFPFTDRRAERRRPALVVSRPEALGNRVGQSVLAMITSAAHSGWPLDVPLTELACAGLPAPSLVRMKLFTLDEAVVEGEELHAHERRRRQACARELGERHVQRPAAMGGARDHGEHALANAVAQRLRTPRWPSTSPRTAPPSAS